VCSLMLPCVRLGAKEVSRLWPDFGPSSAHAFWFAHAGQFPATVIMFNKLW
jgi:hypothetical protein